MQYLLANDSQHTAWNRGQITGQKPPLKRNEIWAIRVHLQIQGRIRDLALFNLAIDSKLRACDLVGLRVRDVIQAGQVARRATVLQRKTKRPVQFEITDQSGAAIGKLMATRDCQPCDYLFCSRRNLGRRNRSGPSSLRNSLPAAHQGHPDLSAHQKPAGGAAAIGSFKDREHCAVLGDRVG
jgi:integrase